MKKTESEFDVHVFVCTNDKKCGPCGGGELQKELKEWMKSKPEWKGRLRINKSGCLDRCEEPIAVAIYPEGKWFVEARPSDAEELKGVLTKLMEKA
ncbi:MAG: (2Fe-2S) ferredoxin domain-containing protein [Bdellovibrionota bacterium]